MGSPVARLVRAVVSFLVYGLVSAVLAAPVAAERAVEAVRFPDRLGSLPVEVSLAHNGSSTLDTGILGRLYWARTGRAGFGAFVRATGPPLAGGTLASYVSPDFVEANALFVNDPGEVARVYGAELRSRLWRLFLWFELGAGILGGLLLTAATRARPPRWGRVGRTRARRLLASSGTCLAALAVSVGTATALFAGWEGTAEITEEFAMPGVAELSFSSPQTLEVARQVQPSIDKFAERTRQEGEAFDAAALSSFQAALPSRASALLPREGEKIVIAEADPQGSRVATRLRQRLYPLLAEALGQEAFALRTISGDITSNGTVAEDGFVELEANAYPGLPVAAAKGDHDTADTVKQLSDHAVANPIGEGAEIAGLRVVAGNDPAFKALFGGLVINDTGVTERDLGVGVRETLDLGEPAIVLLHQPAAAAGYLGIDSTNALSEAAGSLTTPGDDGIPDLPPGIVNIGHLHDADLPRVIWNTDGDQITWTVVNQLGTAGGVDEYPTFNRFSTPFSAPLKPISIQLQYVATATGLETGYADIVIATDGTTTISDRTDLGLPGGLPSEAP